MRNLHTLFLSLIFAGYFSFGINTAQANNAQQIKDNLKNIQQSANQLQRQVKALQSNFHTIQEKIDKIKKQNKRIQSTIDKLNSNQFAGNLGFLSSVDGGGYNFDSSLQSINQSINQLKQIHSIQPIIQNKSQELKTAFQKNRTLRQNYRTAKNNYENGKKQAERERADQNLAKVRSFLKGENQKIPRVHGWRGKQPTTWKEFWKIQREVEMRNSR